MAPVGWQVGQCGCSGDGAQSLLPGASRTKAVRTCLVAIVALFCGCTTLDDGRIHTHGEAYFPVDWLREAKFAADSDPEMRRAYAAAVTALAEGNYAAAETGFADATRQSSSTTDKVTCLIAEALVRMDQQEFDEAVLRLDEAVELSPDDWRPLFHRWQAYRAMGNAGNAATDRERGMTLNKALFERDYQYKRGVI